MEMEMILLIHWNTSNEIDGAVSILKEGVDYNVGELELRV